VSAERDLVWLRPLDVAACLGARTYAVESALVVEVVDAGRAATGGRFRLDGGPDDAACAPTGAEPDVVVRTPDLGALMLGGVTWATLARAGLVDERTKGAVSRADALFRPARAPWCATDF
jgi:predicted acetyltransferase